MLVHRKKIVAFSQSTTYSANSDLVNTAIVDAHRDCWLIKNWGRADHEAAKTAFTEIAKLTYTVEKKYGTDLRTIYDAYYKNNFVA